MNLSDLHDLLKPVVDCYKPNASYKLVYLEQTCYLNDETTNKANKILDKVIIDVEYDIKNRKKYLEKLKKTKKLLTRKKMSFFEYFFSNIEL